MTISSMSSKDLQIKWPSKGSKKDILLPQYEGGRLLLRTAFSNITLKKIDGANENYNEKNYHIMLPFMHFLE